jgi:Fe-S cluster assembly protein SufD
VTATTSTLDRLVPDPATGDPAAHRWLDERGWPDRRQETWRYAPLDAIAAAAVAAGRLPAPPVGPWWAGELERRAGGHPAWAPGAQRLVVVDGRPEPAWSSTAGPAIVEAGPTGPFRPDERTDGFDALNHLAAPTTVTVDAGPDESRGGELHLVQVGTGRPGGSHARTRVRVRAGAHLTLVETYWSLGWPLGWPGDAGLVNATTTIEVDDGGRLDHVRVVDATGAHVGRTTIVAGAGASVRAGTLQLGAGPVRQTITADLAGPGATVELTGLSLPAGGGHHDTDVSVRHLADRGTSRQLQAGIVADGAHASSRGHVLVAVGTAGSDADQHSRSLLLGPTARADTRPWLEIDADDVACTHGATIGRLDDDARFYLRSRGIPERAARALLVAAFATTALDHLAPAGGPTREWLGATVDAAVDGLLDPAGGTR